MGRTEQAVAGGLLKGLGTGLVQRHEAEREAALERAREYRRRLERQDDRDWRTQLQDDAQAHQTATREADQAFRKGLLTSVQPDEDGNLYGITAGGERKGLGVKAAPRSGSGRSGSNADEQRVWTRFEEKHTSVDEMSGQKITDYAAMAKDLRAKGYEALAKDAEPLAGERRGPLSEDPDYKAAEKQAREIAGDKAGWLSSDESDFEEYGGSREEFIRQKTMEIYNSMTGAAGGESAAGGENPKDAGGSKQYSTKEDVKRAYSTGAISREEALKILRENFGME